MNKKLLGRPKKRKIAENRSKCNSKQVGRKSKDQDERKNRN